MPKKPIQWEVYRPIKGSPGAFIGTVEAPDETSALKAAIEEFGIINPEQQTVFLCGACPATKIRLATRGNLVAVFEQKACTDFTQKGRKSDGRLQGAGRWGRPAPFRG